MHVDRALTEHLANLSRLHFSDEALDAMQQDLQRMIGFVEKLNALDTTGIEPLRHMSSVQDVFRHDVAAPPMPAKEALAPAGQHSGQYFLVPKVIS